MRVRSTRGQILVEFAMVLPLLLIIGLGVMELSLVLYEQHIISRLTREGSNLISRNVTLFDAGTSMKTMANAPVDFNTSNSRLIFSVLTRLSAAGQANDGYVILYQRYQIGGLSSSSAFITRGTVDPTTWVQPDYFAPNPGTDNRLQITNIPPSLVLSKGQFVYVTEIYTLHTVITPFNKIGITLPSTLYSIAYF
jgi:hypothetical protein